MKEEDGAIRFGTAIDMSGFDEGMNRIKQKISEVCASAEADSTRLSQLLTDFPTVNIDFTTNAAQSLSTIDQAFEQIDMVIDSNKAAIAELSEEYKRLSQIGASGDGTDNDASSIEEQKQAIQENITLREQIIEVTGKMSDALVEAEQKMQSEAKTFSTAGMTVGEALGAIGAECEKYEQQLWQLEETADTVMQQMANAYDTGANKEYVALRQKYDAIRKEISERKRQLNALREQSNELDKEAESTEKATQKQVSFRTELRKAQNEMKQMVAAGQQNTEAYEQVRQKVIELTQAQNAANKQVKAFATPTAQFQGIMTGLSGISGMLTATTGAMSLFAGENEDLQKIMAKLQSVMAITMGLQQMEMSLNKNSAFQLVTLNGLKEWWNKLCEVGAGKTAELAVATAEETVGTVKNTAATIADTAAQGANNTATTAGTAAVGANTVAQAANTTAAVAGTAANITLAGAFRMVGAAIKSLLASIPVFGWIALGITAIVEAVSWLTSKNEEADKEFGAQQELMKQGREAYAKASVEISDYITKIDKFNGTKEQEKKLVEELNNRYGSAMGYYDSLAQWKDVLKKKGEAYCQMLLKEAEAQAILNKYTEAFVALQEIKDKKASDFGGWLSTKAGNEERKAKAEAEAKAELDKWYDLYKGKIQEKQVIRDDFDLNTHIAPKTINTPKSRKSGKEFDPKAAAREYKKIYEEYVKDVTDFIKDANAKITEREIETAGEGLVRELNDIHYSTYKKEEAWKEQLRQLAEIRKNAIKEQYMTQQGHTDDTWERTKESRKTLEDYEKELLYNSDGSRTELAKKYYGVLNGITEQGEAQLAATRQKYYDGWVQEYGTTEQKIELLERDMLKRMNEVPAEFGMAVFDSIEKQISQLKSKDFKNAINWESVFGNLDEQSLQSLQYNLEKVRSYFNANKDAMGTEEIKEYTEAISRMETAIASRNPFAAFHKSLKDIGDVKTEFTTAMAEWKEAQLGFNEAQTEYNDALALKNELQAQVDDGTLSEDSKEYKNAVDALATAQANLNNAINKTNQAEQKTLTARNNLTSAYKSFATQLKNVGSVVKDLGSKAQNLADAFGGDVAGGIGKALGFMDEIFDATSDVISAIGDVGKSVAKGVETTVDATAQGTTAAAAAGASAISTIEKASVILAAISAALQVATAIADLFNDDEEKQKEIENLQRRIDQLQWELDNAEAVRVRDTVGDAQQKIIALYKETEEEVLKLHLTTQQYGSAWVRMFAKMRYEGEMYEKSIEKIADAYAKLDYTSDKALGQEKYEEVRGQLENLAEQQILLQKQINEEDSKKDTDRGKIEEWQRQMQENAQEMVNIINEMVEDIIGYSAEDITKELGDAFVDAFKEGEDAAQAWKDKVDDIVSDIIKKMMIQELLEEPIGSIFDKYRKKWFGDDGVFKGFDAVNNSMVGFASELNSLVDGFSSSFENLPDELKQYFIGDVEREGTSRGIATASQESVDENNARLTTIQGHTYTLVQGMGELNRTSSAILDKVTGIEKNTSEANTKLDTMSKSVREIKDSVDDISTRGIKLKS